MAFWKYKGKLIIGVIAACALCACGGSEKEAAGSGTALTELVDSAAATYYGGGAASKPSSEAAAEPASQDETNKDAGEENKEEAAPDTSANQEKLFQGCIYATIPAGFVQGGTDGTSEEEFVKEDDKDCIIKLHISSKADSARAAAEDDVAWVVEKKGPDCGYEIVDDVQAGNYTWVIEHFPFNGENSSAKIYADVNDDDYLEITSFMMNESDPALISFLESIHMADGDPDKLRSAWLDSRRKE